MRPLYTLNEEGGYAYHPDDFALHEVDSVLYNELSERGDLLIEEAFKKHMGSFYNKKPMPYFKELKEEYELRLSKKNRLVELGAPEIIIEHEEMMITDLYDKMKNKKFTVKTDSVQRKYREQYDKREADFYETPEYKTLTQEIYQYNLNKWVEKQRELGIFNDAN